MAAAHRRRHRRRRSCLQLPKQAAGHVGVSSLSARALTCGLLAAGRTGSTSERTRRWALAGSLHVLIAVTLVSAKLLLLETQRRMNRGLTL